MIRGYEDGDRSEVIRVWEASGITRRWNDAGKDIDRKVAADPEGFLVAVEEGSVIGTVMAGYEGHRGWIQYLAVDPAKQRAGIGRQLVAAAVELLRKRGCPKVNLQVRRSNTGVIQFYERVGFREDDVLSMGLRLIED